MWGGGGGVPNQYQARDPLPRAPRNPAHRYKTRRRHVGRESCALSRELWRGTEAALSRVAAVGKETKQDAEPRVRPSSAARSERETMSTATDVPEVDTTGPAPPVLSSPLGAKTAKPKKLGKARSRSATDVSIKHSATTGHLSQFSRKKTMTMSGSPTRKKTIDRFFKWAAGRSLEFDDAGRRAGLN